MNRVYDPTIEEMVRAFPRVDVSDVPGARKVVAEFREAMLKSMGRPSHDQVEEVERTIPGPKGAPPLPIRLYVPKDRTEAGPAFVNFHGVGSLWVVWRWNIRAASRWRPRAEPSQ